MPFSEARWSTEKEFSISEQWSLDYKAPILATVERMMQWLHGAGICQIGDFAILKPTRYSLKVLSTLRSPEALDGICQ